MLNVAFLMCHNNAIYSSDICVETHRGQELNIQETLFHYAATALNRKQLKTVMQ